MSVSTWFDESPLVICGSDDFLGQRVSSTDSRDDEFALLSEGVVDTVVETAMLRGIPTQKYHGAVRAG